MRKFISVLLSLIMVLSMVPVMTVTAWAAQGDSAENPILIHSYAELKAFADEVNGGDTYQGKFVELADDFPTETDEAEKVFTTPIGKSVDYAFKGTFDGNGKTVVLSISGMNYAGLFGHVENGTVQNVATTGAVSGTMYAGGVVGKNEYGTVTNCYATGDVTANGNIPCAGGVVGYNEGGKVTNCYATGAVKAIGESEARAGGVVGYDYSNNASVINCYATGAVEATAEFGVSSAGGVVGSNDGTVTNCYATGAVNCDYYAGGVAGCNDGTVTNCYSRSGMVTGSGGDNGTALPETQMQADMDKTDGNKWVALTVGTAISGEKVALVDALNAYVKDYNTANADAIAQGSKLSLTMWSINKCINRKAAYSDKKYPYLANWDTGWYNETDTDFVLYDTADLEGLAKLVNEGNTFKDKTVRLADSFSDDTPLVTPIGDGHIIRDGVGKVGDPNYEPRIVASFQGTFDGNGKTVVLSINVGAPGWESTYAGLFGIVQGGTVKNVTTTGTVTEINKGNCVGGVVGWNVGGTVTNCCAKVAVEGLGASLDIGGVVGKNGDTAIGGTVTNCYATGTVTAGSILNDSDDSNGKWHRVGGVVGGNYSGTITDCYATGAVTAKGEENHAGGVVGWSRNGTITDCYATGAVTANGDGSVAGGVAGYNGGYVDSSESPVNDDITVAVINCYATGDVSGTTAGGVVGDNGGSVNVGNTATVTINSTLTGVVTNCYATGAVSGTTVGGVVGQNGGRITSGTVNGTGTLTGTVTNCYATGNVSGNVIGITGSAEAGGVVGKNGSVVSGTVEGEVTLTGTVANCYAIGIVTATGGTTQKAGGVVGSNTGTVESCYYKTGIADLGIGSSLFDTGAVTTALPEVQMKATSADTVDEDIWKLIGINVDEIGGAYLYLAKALNTFIAGNPIGCPYWVVRSDVNGGYPTFVTYDTDWYNATDTDFVLYDTADLEGFALLVNTGVDDFAGKTVKLADSFNDDTPLVAPIGDGQVAQYQKGQVGDPDYVPKIVASFKGTFDGNGRTVKLNMDNIGSYAGLFGYVIDGTVKNVTVSGLVTCDWALAGIVGCNENGTVENCTAKNCTITGTRIGSRTAGGVGGIVGYSTNGTVKNCSASSVAVSRLAGSDGGVGGIVGTSQIVPLYSEGAESVLTDTGSATIINCHVTGTIKDQSESGCAGIVGRVAGGCYEEDYTSSVRIIGCDFEGTVFTYQGAGGIFGYCEYYGDILIEDCEAAGKITATSGMAGGIAGFCMGTIKDCSYLEDIVSEDSEGPVSGGTCVGGIVGNMSGEILNCSVTGNVSGVPGGADNICSIGGIAGVISGKVTNCYVTGDVTVTGGAAKGVFDVGGIVGNGSAINCYIAGTVTATSEVSKSNVGAIVGSGVATNCYYEENEEYNGIGAAIGKTPDVAGSTTALPESQMKGTASSTDWVDITVKTTASSTTLTCPTLKEALNTYADSAEGKTAGCETWTANESVNDGYPTFGSDTGVSFFRMLIIVMRALVRVMNQIRNNFHLSDWIPEPILQFFRNLELPRLFTWFR